MNTTKSIYNKLFKKEEVELATQKIELGIVEDIAAASAKAIQISNALFDAVDKADNMQIELNKLQAEYQKQVDAVKKLYPTAEKYQQAEDKLYDKAVAAAKNLGLSERDIKGWADFSKNGISVNSAINAANKYMS
jgi:hypothetical protein